MKAMLFAGVAVGIYLIAVTVLFRLSVTTRRAAIMVLLFAVSVPVFPIGYLAVPADLWILPPALAEPVPWIEAGFSLFVYTALVWGGVLQLYNLADRGFSLRILIDILEAQGPAAGADDLARRYGGGRGIAWMYDKRIDGLVASGLAVVRSERLVITPRGQRTARLFGALRRLLRLPGPDADRA